LSAFASHIGTIRDYWLSNTRPEEWLLIEWPDGEKEPIKYWCRCGLNVTSPTRLQRDDGDWLDDPTTDRSGGRSNTPSVRSLMGGCEEAVPR
jgi:hypothetical protein